MGQFFLYTLALVPLLLFVIVVVWMDAFSLTDRKRLAFCLLSGAISYILVFVVEQLHPKTAAIPYMTAILSEFFKGIPILYLIYRRKIVMLGDATIYGSAVGAGYGIGENIHIVATAATSVSNAHAVMLGFEAAVMHIGCTSLLASTLIVAKQETNSWSFATRNLTVAVVFLAVMGVHIIHNVVPINPILLTAILVVYFVLSKRHLFKKNEKAVHDWIDQCLNNDVALLASIKKGQLSQTNAGKYLLSIRDAFAPETFFDICCYISEYLELSISAKSNLILKEAGFPVVTSERNKARIKELHALRRRIGRAGVQAVAPIVNIDDVDHWVLEELL